MPPRPSSVQSDGILHSSINQSAVGQDRGEASEKHPYSTDAVPHAFPQTLLFLIYLIYYLGVLGFSSEGNNMATVYIKF